MLKIIRSLKTIINYFILLEIKYLVVYYIILCKNNHQHGVNFELLVFRKEWKNNEYSLQIFLLLYKIAVNLFYWYINMPSIWLYNGIILRITPFEHFSDIYLFENIRCKATFKKRFDMMWHSRLFTLVSNQMVSKFQCKIEFSEITRNHNIILLTMKWKVEFFIHKKRRSVSSPRPQWKTD